MNLADAYNRPVPEPTPHSARYWEGLNERRLLLQKCAHCGRIRHYPQPMCPSCHLMEIEWIEAAGCGKVHSWTITHHAFHPAFRDNLPYILATVDLNEGVRMNAELRGVAPERIRIGLPVRVAFETVKDGLTLPYLVAEGTR